MTNGPRTSEADYLRKVERLAREVVELAGDWVTFGDEGQTTEDPLHRAINRLATELRYSHFDGDGCIDH